MCPVRQLLQVSFLTMRSWARSVCLCRVLEPFRDQGYLDLTCRHADCQVMPLYVYLDPWQEHLPVRLFSLSCSI